MNSEPSHDYRRVYVWEQPVRWFHWINAAAILVLGVSGWLIAHPPALLTSSEASAAYWFGTVRFAHFAMGYVFAANLAFRIYWSFVGNKFASWRNFLPLTRAQLRQVWQVLQVDILQSSNKPVHTLGHNAVAYFTYAGTLGLSLFQIVSGFALYAPTSDAWFPQLFAWVAPLFGSEQNLRVFHYAVTWAFAIFTLVHVYLVFYHDYVEGHGVASSIIGGWKFMEKHQANAEQATGISALVTGRRRARSAPQRAPQPQPVEELPLDPNQPASILVLGVGNVLMGDEGVGVHAIRRLEQEPAIPGVRLLDGGTGGVNLLAEFDDMRAVILIDATRDGQVDGMLRYRVVPRIGDLPRGLGAHDFGLKDLFAAGALLGRLPQLHLYTISVSTIRPMCLELSPAIAAALPALVRLVRKQAGHLAKTFGRSARPGHPAAAPPALPADPQPAAR